jgi:hypothetical protein
MSTPEDHSEPSSNVVSLLPKIAQSKKRAESELVKRILGSTRLFTSTDTVVKPTPSKSAARPSDEELIQRILNKTRLFIHEKDTE